jgi:hypothetical protein
VRRLGYKTAVSLLSLTLLIVFPAAGHAQYGIDFESFDLMGAPYLDTVETLVFPDVQGSGVTVTIEGHDDVRIYDLFQYAGDPNITGQAMIDMNWLDYNNPAGTDFHFDPPVANFFLHAGDFGADDDSPLSITAYDSGGNVIATDSAPWPETAFPPFAQLSVGVSGIKRVHYLSGGDYMNSTFIDLLGFDATSPVDETSWGRIKAQFRN